MAHSRHAADIQKLEELVRLACAEAIKNSEDIKQVCAALAAEGVRLDVSVKPAVTYNEPDYIALEQLAKRPRMCPVCSSKEKAQRMVGLVSHHQPASKDRVPMKGLQVRWRCQACSFGEVISFSVDPPK